MFFMNVWRGFWRPYGTFRRAPRFNPLHTAAVEGWLHRRLDIPLRKAVGGELRQRSTLRYIAFGWRSETVPAAELPNCALQLAKQTLPVLSAAYKAGAPRAVLVSDIPALSNPCRSWHVYKGTSNDESRKSALGRLTDIGLAKYDDEHGTIDAGVLAIRDWLLAVRAKRFVTCHVGAPGRGGASSACRRCFRHTSKYVAQILAARNKASRVSLVDWFSVTDMDLQLAAFSNHGFNSSEASRSSMLERGDVSALPLPAVAIGPYVPPPSIL